MSQTAKLLQTATTHHQAGRLQDAEKAYRKLLLDAPAHGDGLRLLGGLYLQMGQPVLATEVLEKAAHLLPEDVETQTNLAVALRAGGRREEAVALLIRITERYPDYRTALNNLGGLYQEMGKPHEALGVFGHLMRLDPTQPTPHFSTGNVLLSLGRIAEAAGCYEQALKLKPDYLEAMINLGIALGYAGRGDEGKHWLVDAEKMFRRVLQSDPTNAVALNNLGNILRQQDRAEEAVASFRAALAARPTYADAAINMATALRDLNQIEEAVESCRQALRLQPDSANARINLGTMLQDLRRHEEAVQVFDEALCLKPTSIDAPWNKALSLLSLGRYREGWALHEIGLGIDHMRGENPSPERRWRGEDIAGKRLLIWCEQGLGDTLQFVRYAKLCKQRGATIIILCPRALRRLLSNCPFIDHLPETIEEKDFDTHISTMSLPYVFGTELQTIPIEIPYLFVGDEARAKWAGKISRNGFKVGLVWAGNPREKQLNAHMADRKRSISLELLKPLFDVPNTRFYNLQMGVAVGQIVACGLQDSIMDVMCDVKDFEDTAAIIEQLDLVISVDTSVVHLAGGLGKPVWVLSRFDACWRWLQNRTDSPWYSSARIFGQKTHGDWSGVVDDVAKALQAIAS